MEVQWVGVESPKLGPPHTAVSLLFSVLLGNVSAFLIMIMIHLNLLSATPLLLSNLTLSHSLLIEYQTLVPISSCIHIVKYSSNAVACLSLALTFICF